MVPFQRKSPEELLLSIAKLHRGRLKIIIGAVSGSGKTYHMLQEGTGLKRDGIDVVICAVSTLQRPETVMQLGELERISSIHWWRDGIEQKDLDLDALVSRNPEVVLVDGLAHHNRAEARFPTRLEDVLFLLDKGISVITTINVYELEGADEAALKWTGIRAPFTVPANTLELADEVRLIDASPETILKRLEEGVLGRQTNPAIARRDNLAVLRELSLRIVAEGVNGSLEKHREELRLTGPSGASERILVTAQYHWNGSIYIRRGQQIAKRLNGDILVVSFVRPGRNLTKEEQTFKNSIMKLTKKVDGKFQELPLRNRRMLSAELVRYADEQLVTRIVMGHSKQNRWQQFWQGSVVDDLLRKRKQVDLFLMADRAEHEGERIMPVRQKGHSRRELYRRFSVEEKERQMEKIHRGTFHVYVGAAPGVGKTYTMLIEANVLLRRGVDIIVGLVETHGRADTLKQIGGLPLIEQQTITYKGTLLKEMDVEAIIRRNPEVVLVDELAHTNVPGSLRKKRYEDVLHLLNQGISVVSTMNIQHIESLNDAIEQITGIRVKETVPDAILQLANQVELIDVTPQMLKQRMKEGKIYAMDKVQQALGAFFTTGNIIALRELALREIADDVDERLEAWDFNRSLRGPLRRREVIFVCVDICSNAERLIRRGFRLAYRLKSEWHVHYVQEGSNWTGDMEGKRDAVLKLTERLGGIFEMSKTENGNQIAAALLAAADRAKATQLVIGQSNRPLLNRLWKGNVVSQLLRGGRHMDMLIVANRVMEK